MNGGSFDINANSVGLLLFCIALLTPFSLGYNIAQTELSLLGAYWIYGYGYSGIRALSIVEILIYNLFIVPRHFFIYQMMKLYQMRTSRKRAILAGLLSDSPSIALSIISLTGQVARGLSILVLPTPFPLLVGLMLLRFARQPGQQSSVIEESDPWWEDTGVGNA